MDVQEAYEKTVHCYRLSMRMLKFATYVVLHIGVLMTALVSKGALLLMTNAVSKVQDVSDERTSPARVSSAVFQTPYRERWVWMLLTAICAPYVFTFVDSFGKCLFGNKPWPTVKIFTIVRRHALLDTRDDALPIFLGVLHRNAAQFRHRHLRLPHPA